MKKQPQGFPEFPLTYSQYTESTLDKIANSQGITRDDAQAVIDESVSWAAEAIANHRKEMDYLQQLSYEAFKVAYDKLSDHPIFK